MAIARIFRILGRAVAGLALAGGLLATPAAARAPLVVGADYGGSVAARMAQISDLRQSGQEVRITGRVCYSSCTLLVSLPRACVDPGTVFGFHGPSRSGRPLDPATFERTSRIIAAHYPAPLRRWYLGTARHRIDGVHRMRGADLIAMGVRAC